MSNFIRNGAFVSLSVLLLAACTPAASITPIPPTSTAITEAPTLAATQPPTESTPTTPAVETEATPTTSSELAIEPITVTYFTPAQTEGPYYPPNKPDDRDNDLTIANGSTTPATGDMITLQGKLYDSAGMPITGATIEIWHTDDQGIYLHPNDSRLSERDQNFQGYGESVTDADGSYSFRTIKPGLYEGRPRHIHVKVRWQGQEVLTTQFYFLTESDGAFVSGDDLIAVSLDLITQTDGTLLATRDIVLNQVLQP
jgi:protocatechuate 3,4-dioxygenase beta subunit